MAKRWERYIANHGTPSKGATTITIVTLDLTTLYVIVLNATFSITILSIQSQYVDYCYAECHYAECRSVECRGAPKTAAFGSIAEIFLEKTTTNHKEIFIRELGCKERERERERESGEKKV